MTYEIVERLPTPEEYNYLRESVGWGIYERDVAAGALPNSLYGVCVVEGNAVIGMGRVIGDRGLCFYIQDVIVTPPNQRRGIGRRIMDKLMQYIKDHAQNNSVIGLMAAKGVEPFYEHYGFTRRPNERLGCGMTLFYS